MFGKRNHLLALAIMMTGLLVTLAPLSAAVKDSDADGVTDQAEKEMYLTNPNEPDTDNDSFSDGEELVGGTDPLNRESNPLRDVANQVAARPFLENQLLWESASALAATTILLGVAGYFIARKRRSLTPPETLPTDTD